MSEAELDDGFYGDAGEGEPTAVGDGSAMLDMSVLMGDPVDSETSSETSPLEDPANAAPESPEAIGELASDLLEESLLTDLGDDDDDDDDDDDLGDEVGYTAARAVPDSAEIDEPVSDRWTPPTDSPSVADNDPFGPADLAAPAADRHGLGGDDSFDATSPEGVAELERILSERLVTMMYQPITSLLDDSVVGYEALARGPEGSPLATPAEMFAVADNAGRLRDLDLLCQEQAVLQARDVLLKSGHALFVKAEASVLSAAAFGSDPEAAAHFDSLLTNITAACPVVLEISDLDTFASTAELLGVTMWARGKGFRVALDDVGVGPRSLAVLPLVEPDVIKLKFGITQASPDAELGELLSVIRSQSERTGAAVVCPGIESEEERQVALSFGATHVQGFAIGHPEELSDAPLRIRSLEPVGAMWGEPCSTPFELVANSSQVRTGTEDLMLALTLDLERQAKASSNSVILSSFERTVGAPGAVASRYEELAESCGFVVALGQDLGEMRGVFSGEVQASDALSGERAIVVMTPQFSAALLGRMAGGAAGDRKYAYALIYDRGQVTRAARMLTAYVDL